jgi:hypothetical protein
MMDSSTLVYQHSPLSSLSLCFSAYLIFGRDRFKCPHSHGRFRPVKSITAM